MSDLDLMKKLDIKFCDQFFFTSINRKFPLFTLNRDFEIFGGFSFFFVVCGARWTNYFLSPILFGI